MNVHTDLPYNLVLLEAEAREILHNLKDDYCALDFETTSLYPDSGRVRLTALYCDKFDKPIILDHYFCGPLTRLAPDFVGPLWIVYNAKFELRWFDDALPNQVDVLDVDFMAKAKLGGYVSSLDRMCQRDLKIKLSKDLQRSDWSRKELTIDQYKYAAADAVHTWKLYKYWKDQLADHPIDGGAYDKRTVWIQQEVVRPTIECEETGMVLDVNYHWKNVQKWKMKQALCLRTIRKYTPKSAIDNLNSDKQVSDFLLTQIGESLKRSWPRTDKKKQLSLTRDSLRPIIRQVGYPFSRWLTAFMRYRYYNKYLSTYGETLITKQQLADKIDYRLNIALAATKRYSSSNMNIQNLPRAAYVRNAFLPPEGCEFFVTADYSGIEIRVLAELSGDKDLLRDAIYGNMHGSMAALANHIDEDEFLEKYESNPKWKEMRSKAKAGTFRMTYGAGAGAVSDSLNSTVQFAEDFIRKWAARYPLAYDYRNKMFDILNATGFLPMVDGSTVYLAKRDRELPKAANYPVQGAAALVMMAAMNRVWDLRNQLSHPTLIRLCATVHDELILAVRDEKHIPMAKTLLERGMTQGWLDVFPNTDTTNLIEAGHGRRWGACK